MYVRAGGHGRVLSIHGGNCFHFAMCDDHTNTAVKIPQWMQPTRPATPTETL